MTNSASSNKPKRNYRQKTADDWKKLVKQCAESKLSTAEFCQQNDIAQSGLYSWRKRFASKEKTTTTGEFVELPPELQNTSLPLPQVEDKTWDVELVLGQGCTLRIRAA